jgi:FKBP-type peptidyl-prolyl cis-trans isomerase FklB
MQRFLMLFLVIPFLCIFLQSCHKSPRPVTMGIDNPLINQEVGALFLAKNKLKPDISLLPNGLQYFVIQQGIGDHPGPNDRVTVYYQGQYIDNRVFDNKYYQNEPLTVRVSATIPAWQQALQLMHPGSVWVLYVPPQLAYGDKGLPGLIGPRQTVIYTVHLMGFKKQ